MKIEIDVQENCWSVDGDVVRGTRRWEAAFLALLLRDGHRHAGLACGAGKLRDELAALGQTQPLNRKQMGRLLDGLLDAFTQAQRLPDLLMRLGHAPRGRTVGPWWWSQAADDVWSLTSSTAPRATGVRQLPGLAKDGRPSDTAALCRHLLACSADIWEGDSVAALLQLDDSEIWSTATEELRVLLQIRRADVLLSLRNLSGAKEALDAASVLIGQCGIASAYLSGQILLLRNRVSYAESPTANYKDVMESLTSIATRPPGLGLAEVDATTRGGMLNLLALSDRRWLEEHGADAPRADREMHIDRAQRYWFAALFGFLASGNNEYVQHMCSNLAYFYQRISQFGLGSSSAEALDWYGLSRGWHNRFGLSDNVVWEHIFLGDYWLYQPAVREDFEWIAGKLGWQGHRPDELDFYVFAERRASEIGEPRQMAHTALNLFHFARERGEMSMFNMARERLEVVLREHPDVRQILSREGYQLP